MGQQARPEPVAQSFADHVRAFHASLPGEEQALLEQVFALAGQAAERRDDAQGYSKIERVSAAARPTPALGAPLGIELFTGVDIATQR
jgi:hypothetical protein